MRVLGSAFLEEGRLTHLRPSTKGSSGPSRSRRPIQSLVTAGVSEAYLVGVKVSG